MKKMISMVCVFGMFLTLFMGALTPMAVLADTNGEYEYELSLSGNNTIEITKYKGDATELTVPTEIDGYTVSEIGISAFQNCMSLKKVIISDSINTISSMAFSGCVSLENVYISKSVNYIYSGAFGGCTSLEEFVVDEKNTVYASIDGVVFDKAISRVVCYPQNKKMVCYTVPSTVTKIDIRAFYDNRTMERVILPNTLETIESMAFYKCCALKEVEIPESVKSIGSDAFASCQSLETVGLPKSISVLEGATFSTCHNLKKMVIPNGVTKIEYRSFFGAKALMSVYIPNSVTTIGNGAFDICNSLTDVYYNGTEQDWNKITIDTYNEDLVEARFHFVGDYNGDGKIDLREAVRLFYVVNGLVDLEVEEELISDINKDESITVNDVICMLELINNQL